MLHGSWTYKRSLVKDISNSVSDKYYEEALKAGAIGGKLLGAGEEGFLLFYVEPHNQSKVKHALRNLK